MITDLFERYGLEEIAASVARVDDSGQKKSVRKTYKNYMRTLSGAFDSVKKDEGSPDTMLFMMQLPQEEWDAKIGRTAHVEKGLPEEALANLGKAVTMTRGVIPKSAWNPSVLGELNSVPVAPAAKIGLNGVRKPIPIPQAATVARAVKGEAARPKRSTTKRHYGDASFEGYGEGFVDDDLQDTGSFTGDDDDKSGGRKRPKKVWNLLQNRNVMANKTERTRQLRISKTQPAKTAAMALVWLEPERRWQTSLLLST
jgi:hypothetical protein